MGARLELNVRGGKAYFRRSALAWLTAFCLLTVRKAKELLSVPGTGRVKGKKTGPVTHSAPGEPPRKQTGRGRGSVTYELDEATLTARAGTNVDYMADLERGTGRVRPRPWLRPAYLWAAQQMRSWRPPA